MLMPSIFGENLFDDDWMNFPFNDEFWGKKNPLYGKHAQNMMKTDIRETDGSYELDVDLPGFKKDEIKVQLKDGYLTLSAAKGLDKYFFAHRVCHAVAQDCCIWEKGKRAQRRQQAVRRCSSMGWGRICQRFLKTLAASSGVRIQAVSSHWVLASRT